MALIVIRIHPQKPTSGDSFQAYLDGLEITVGERSYADPKGVVRTFGPAQYIAEGDPNATIIQHWRLMPGPVFVRMPLATALIEVPDPPFGFAEYQSLDLVLTVTRQPAAHPLQKVISKDINFNVDLAPGALPPSDPLVYAAVGPVSLYIPLPPPLVGLGPGVAFLDVGTDGTPPPYDDVVAAVTTVVNADPGGPPDLAALTVEKCQHIAWEIVSNRALEPFPARSTNDLEDWYSGGHDQELQQFEAELLTYYTVHGTRADVLAKFIYAMSAAMACERRTQNATQVGFTFPILPGLNVTSDRVGETTVVISQ